MMHIDRRGLLGMAGAAIVFGAGAGRAAVPPRTATLAVRAGGRRYADALAAIRAYAIAELEATGLPGMTLSIVDNDGFAATMCVGWADVDARVPVRPDHLFEIGSISKSLCALWLHAAADQGRVDLSAPVSRYLPDVPLPAQPITLLQLLDHISGLPADAPVFPRSPDGRLWTGYTPGTRFSYSNIGYTLLGLVVDRIAGRPHAQVLTEEVIQPLGMAGGMAHIRMADRARYAIGYAPLIDDRPALMQVPMTPGPWTDLDMAAGSVVASGDAMAGYLRFILALGQGRGAPLMRDAAARAMLANPVGADEFGKEARYASGIALVPIDGTRVLHHTGGMLTFSSSFHADPTEGVACFASVNGRLDDYRPRRTTAFAVQALRAARAGSAIPAMPDPRAFRAITRPEDYAGRYVAAGGETMELRLEGGALSLAADGQTGRLEQVGKDALSTDHPIRAVHLLQFERQENAVARMWWGGTLFGRDGAPARRPVSPRLKALEGTYIAGDPWAGAATIVARGNMLVLDGMGELVERAGGFWSSAHDPGGVDRFWFQAPVNGRPSRLTVNGSDLIRMA